MTTEKSIGKYVWVIMLVLSLLFLAWTSLVFAGGSAILEQSLKLAGSPMVTGDFDEAALGFLTMAMRKPLWEEIWIGVLVLFELSLGFYLATFGMKEQVS